MRGFGDSLLVTHYDLDSLSCNDSFSLVANFSSVISDPATVSDTLRIFDTFSSAISESEELIFNAGFGCSLVGADGFGLNTFGR